MVKVLSETVFGGKFVRITHTITRYLYVGNLGPDLDAVTDIVYNLLAPYSPDVQLAVPEPVSKHFFAVFPSEDEAEAALTALWNKPIPELNGEALRLQYSQLKIKGPPPPPKPVARTAQQLNVPGLQLIHNFITPEHETALLQAVSKNSWHSLAKRRVQHYGWAFDYTVRLFNRNLGPLPPWVQTITSAINVLPGVEQELDQLTVNEYEPGVGISPHIDTHQACTGAIPILSLGSDAVMDIRLGDDHRPLLLPRRSLLILCGESRYAWQHYIPHRKIDELGPPPDPSFPTSPLLTGQQPGSESVNTLDDGQTWPQQLVRGTRVSFTFRKVRGYPCDCAWPEFCDTKQGGPLPTRIGTLGLNPHPFPDKAPEDAVDEFPIPPEEIEALKQIALSSDQGDAGSSRSGSPAIINAVIKATGAAAALQHHTHLHESGPDLIQASHMDAVHTVCDTEIQGEDLNGQRAANVEQGRDDSVRQAAENGCGIDSDEQDNDNSDDSVDKGQGRGKDKAAEQLESAHVHAVYDAIAGHFSSTRFAIWPKVREFITWLPPGAVVADVGCGNGKYFGVRADIVVLGAERSAGLCEVAARRIQPIDPAIPVNIRADVLQADGMQLPYKSNTLDGVLCIAVLHHISSIRRRIEFLSELNRVLRPGGRAIVTVWALEQEDPKKTIDKWTRMSAEEVAALEGNTKADSNATDTTSTSHQKDAGKQSSDTDGSHGVLINGKKLLVGVDYMVPWHLPFHRAGAHAGKAMNSKSDASSDAGSSNTQDQAGESSKIVYAGSKQDGSHLGGAKADATASVAHDKGAVVFQRYYHLFEKGELEQLVEQVENCRLIDCVFDKSNWCIVFERT